ASTSQSGVFAVFKQDPGTEKQFTGGAFALFNFPNPFDLKSKNVVMQDVNSNFSQTITGTLLKYSLPLDKGGRVRFYIYNLAGELVKEIDEGERQGGFYYYTEWDGTNDNGEECASGVYFLVAKSDGKKLNSKPLKVAILK
ncbi:MAG: FlgD immunoglobulin-like domain containing protein, partial [Endomicrobiales bacterium]